VWLVVEGARCRRHARPAHHLLAALASLRHGTGQRRLQGRPRTSLRLAVSERVRAAYGQRVADGVADRRPLHRCLSTSSRSATLHRAARLQQHRRRHLRVRHLLPAEILREPQQVCSQGYIE